MVQKSTDGKAAAGGIKGFFQNAYRSVEKLSASGGSMAVTGAVWFAKTAGTWGFYVATTAMVTFMPLFFEIGRERQQLDTERSLVKDLRTQGYGDRQLQELGFSQAAIHEPSVASMKK